MCHLISPTTLTFLFLLAISLVCVWGDFIKYNTSAGPMEGKLYVHLVAHTHDDVGWLKTIDQYYVGSNNSIQGACVSNVLDSLVISLMKDPNRKFVYVEQAFFQRWWAEQNEETQEEVKKLVDSGQLEFILAPKIPEVILSESHFKEVALAFHRKLHVFITILYDIARGEDLKHFLLTIGSLWMLSVVGSYFSSISLLYSVYT